MGLFSRKRDKVKHVLIDRQFRRQYIRQLHTNGWGDIGDPFELAVEGDDKKLLNQAKDITADLRGDLILYMYDPAYSSGNKFNHFVFYPFKKIRDNAMIPDPKMFAKPPVQQRPRNMPVRGPPRQQRPAYQQPPPQQRRPPPQQQPSPQPQQPVQQPAPVRPEPKPVPENKVKIELEPNVEPEPSPEPEPTPEPESAPEPTPSGQATDEPPPTEEKQEDDTPKESSLEQLIKGVIPPTDDKKKEKKKDDDLDPELEDIFGDI